jgi:hypothetical protein
MMNRRHFLKFAAAAAIPATAIGAEATTATVYLNPT